MYIFMIINILQVVEMLDLELQVVVADLVVMEDIQHLLHLVDHHG